MPHAAGLWYEWHGPDDGEVLILSAGLGGSASYWTPNLSALAGRFRVLAYDHRGTGRSDRRLPDALTVEDMAIDLLALMDELGIERAHVLGHALGGLIGMAAALAAPERIGRLVVINGWGRLEPHTARCFDARLSLLRDSGPEAYLSAQPIFLFPANWLALNEEAIEAETIAQARHFPGAEIVEKRVAAVRAFDIQDRLGEIASPLLTVSAEDDILVPSIASSRIVDRLSPESLGTEVIMQWGGHACNVTAADDFNDFVPAWLAGEPIPEE
ncbi:MAG TPA: pyrimidine utilization protein D [Allosphingosinicella sp.]|nr:pyrimidine utilization protein D [Allosphingosinicella sp.]